MANVPFELSMLGGALERRYRRLRPDVERLPWGSLEARSYPTPLVEEARRFWTMAAFQEHRTAVACAATIQALMVARAPVDLIAVMSKFILDEMAHVEVCARIAAELGGGAPLLHDPSELAPRPSMDLPPLVRAAELIVDVFCVGESFSLPMQKQILKTTRHPLLSGAWRLISRDEAAHASFGWTFLDWAQGSFDNAATLHLQDVARRAIAEIMPVGDDPPPSPQRSTTLGWLPLRSYRAAARKTIDEHVRRPLRERGLLAD
jgi:hypothetical protein